MDPVLEMTSERLASSGDPATLVFERDGRRLGALDWGGDGTVVILLHPNGFCGGMFDPIARRLASTYHPIAFDLGGHGASDPPRTFSFRALAEDVAFCLDGLGIETAFAVGASLGGGVSVSLNALRGGLLNHVVLAEAVAFRPVARASASSAFIEQARRRRLNWPSRVAMENSFGSRPPLDALAPDVLRAYLRWGVVDEPDGTVSLACLPETEAQFYGIARSPDGGSGAWDQLPALKRRATVLVGSRSDLDKSRFSRQAAALCTSVVTVDAGHLLLFEDTDRAVSLISDAFSGA